METSLQDEVAEIPQRKKELVKARVELSELKLKQTRIEEKTEIEKLQLGKQSREIEKIETEQKNL